MKKTCLLLAAFVLLSCRSALAVGWWEEPWTASQTPYAVARKAVDRVRGNPKALSALVAKWHPQTQRKPFDHLVQYRWGYALYWLTRARVGEEDTKAYKQYGAVRDALNRSTFGDSEQARMRNCSYEFNRLRFWVEQRCGFPLWQLGERVLTRNPNDAETQNSLLKIWTWNCPIDRKAQAVALWRKVEVRHRNDPMTIYWLASIYNSAYNANYDDPRRSIADLRRANELYRQFLNKAPATPRFKSARHWGAYGLKSNTNKIQRAA